MLGTVSGVDRLWVMFRPPLAVVRVVGRGSFKNSPALKDFVADALANGAESLALDMSACAGMDSTFMGVLAGIAMRLRKENRGGEVILVNLDDKLSALLTTLGLNLIVHGYAAGTTPSDIALALACESGLQTVSSSGAEPRRTAETMLEAHQNLVDISPKNLAKFRDVIEYLREDVNRKHGAGGTL